VYLGTNLPLPLKARNLSTQSYKPGVLTGNTQYYWKVIARDNHGTITESPMLSFTTGEPLVECSFVPESTTLRRGNTLSIHASVTNKTDKSGSVLFATKVTLPNGNNYPSTGYLIGPLSATLEPFGSRTVELSHTIPQTAPLGTYIYHGYVGNYGKGLYHECQFNFNVVQQ
jgi:hypothetical protein